MAGPNICSYFQIHGRVIFCIFFASCFLFLSGILLQVPSADIVYETVERVPKFVGKYLLGDVLGEGSYARVRIGTIVENNKLLPFYIALINPYF